MPRRRFSSSFNGPGRTPIHRPCRSRTCEIRRAGGVSPPLARRGTVDRYWLLTTTTYGTWLPGDERGFVSNLANEAGKGERHNVPGTPCDEDLPRLRAYMVEQLKCPP